VWSKWIKLKKKLSVEYRAGRRWLAYDILKSDGWLGRLQCFADFSTATDWCRAKCGEEGIFRIRVLAEVLAGLNGILPTAYTPADRQTLCELVSRRPITSNSGNVSVETGLFRQRHFPVLWSTILEPLRVVQAYHIVSRSFTETGKVTVRMMGAYMDFGRAMRVFWQAYRVQQPSEELLLAGSFHKNVDLTARELVPADGVVLFYRSPVGIVDREAKAEVEQVNDPTMAVVVRTAYFAGYDRQRGQINFFDGGLKRAEPGMVAERLDLEYFDCDSGDIFEGIY
jgi:hypothetical protein